MFKSTRRQAADYYEQRARELAAEARGWRLAAADAQKNPRIPARDVNWAKSYASECEKSARACRDAARKRRRWWQ